MYPSSIGRRLAGPGLTTSVNNAKRDDRRSQMPIEPGGSTEFEVMTICVVAEQLLNSPLHRVGVILDEVDVLAVNQLGWQLPAPERCRDDGLAERKVLTQLPSETAMDRRAVECHCRTTELAEVLAEWNPIISQFEAALDLNPAEGFHEALARAVSHLMSSSPVASPEIHEV